MNAIYSAGTAIENGMVRDMESAEDRAFYLEGLAIDASNQLRAEFLAAARVGPQTLLDVPGESKALTLGHWLGQELDEAAIDRLLTMVAALARAGDGEAKKFWGDMADLYDQRCCDALVERLEDAAAEQADENRADARRDARMAA